jgi:hypothetical protein
MRWHTEHTTAMCIKTIRVAVVMIRLKWKCGARKVHIVAAMIRIKWKCGARKVHTIAIMIRLEQKCDVRYRFDARQVHTIPIMVRIKWKCGGRPGAHFCYDISTYVQVWCQQGHIIEVPLTCWDQMYTVWATGSFPHWKLFISPAKHLLIYVG